MNDRPLLVKGLRPGTAQIGAQNCRLDEALGSPLSSPLGTCYTRAEVERFAQKTPLSEMQAHNRQKLLNLPSSVEHFLSEMLAAKVLRCLRSRPRSQQNVIGSASYRRKARLTEQAQSARAQPIQAHAPSKMTGRAWAPMAQRILDQGRGRLLRHADQAAAETRRLQRRDRPPSRHQTLPRRAQSEPAPLRLDRRPRQDHRQCKPWAPTVRSC